MASFDLNVEDSSPLFSYSPDGAWTDSPDGDSLVSSYSGSSLHTTAAQGATATINFNGTGISLFGAKRPNYGTYTISVDGKVITNGTANSNAPSLNQLLGEAKGLPSGSHSAVLTNTGNGTSVDIDRVQLHDQIGSAGDTVVTTNIDDTDPRIQFGPSPSSWVQNNRTAFVNSSLHYSSDPNASATMEFSGNAVAVYGTISPDHAGINFQIDGQSVTMSGGAGRVSKLYPQTMLFYADNLGSQQHRLVMTSRPSAGSPYIDLDAITVYSTSGEGTSRNAPENGNNQSGNKPANTPVIHKTTAHSTSHIPVIIGVVAGLFVLLALLGAVFYILRRRRNRARKNWSPLTPELPLQGPDMAESGLGSGFRSVPITPNRLSLTDKSPRFFPGSRSSFLKSRRASPTPSVTPLVMPSTPPESRTRISPVDVSRFIPSDYAGTSTNQPPISTRQPDVSRFTISDYGPKSPSMPLPPMPPMPAETVTRQPRDVSRFTISDYADTNNATAPPPKRPPRPLLLKIPEGR